MAETREAFLAAAGWAGARATPLAGDASARRYTRLTAEDGASAILMEAPADGSTAKFDAIAAHLRTAGLSAPKIHAADIPAGRLLLEDLGDDIFAARIRRHPQDEAPLYRAAVDLLGDLHAAPAPDWLPHPDARALADMTAPALDWYCAAGQGGRAKDTAGHGGREDEANSLAEALHPALSDVVAAAPTVLVHRDFHAENMVWLPERASAARVGLLDFQDALAGPPVYDLVSLVEDARRDLADGLATDLIVRYATRTGHDAADITGQAAVLGAQRNLRILGVFARLSLTAGKARYIDLIPRVWAHLQGDLAHPALTHLRAVVARTLPPPDQTHLDRLRRPCPAPQMP